MEAFAEQNGYSLELGWKVELARAVQKAAARIGKNTTSERLKQWKKLFDKLIKG